MRGKLKHLGDLIDHRWIIPAHAGQTYRYGCGRHRQPDHPRACGANGGANCRRWHAIGSSPRMRGKHAVAGAARRVVRIIPAHAGQTSGLTYPMPSVADHPRACGANDFISDIVASLCGSSPRMRGKPERLFVRACRPRIIPAHAGQTGERPSNARPLADHPRACGANLQLVEGFGGSFFGSSPRMRGKLLNCATPVEILRIIPAHAGQTSTPSSLSNHCSDHPRACGANVSSDGMLSRCTGSSPRMRGKLVSRHAVDADVRIIPAHAGQTLP